MSNLHCYLDRFHQACPQLQGSECQRACQMTNEALLRPSKRLILAARTGRRILGAPACSEWIWAVSCVARLLPALASRMFAVTPKDAEAIAAAPSSTLSAITLSDTEDLTLSQRARMLIGEHHWLLKDLLVFRCPAELPVETETGGICIEPSVKPQVRLAEFLAREGAKPQQIQRFTNLTPSELEDILPCQPHTRLGRIGMRGMDAILQTNGWRRILYDVFAVEYKNISDDLPEGDRAAALWAMLRMNPFVRLEQGLSSDDYGDFDTVLWLIDNLGKAFSICRCPKCQCYGIFPSGDDGNPVNCGQCRMPRLVHK